MTARELTRRSLLLGAAGALLGEGMRPAGSLAWPLAPAGPQAPVQPLIFQRALGALAGAPAVASVELGRNADLVGIGWSGPPRAHIEVRFREQGGAWSRWVSAGEHGHAPEGMGRSQAALGDPIWTGGSSLVQVRSARPLAGVRISCVDVSGGVGAREQALSFGPSARVAALELIAPTLPAGPGQPPIVARRAWAQGLARPRVAPAYGAVRMAFVHHTESPNGYSPQEVPAMLRAIFAFHRYVRGWNDIGYNFVVDLYGRIFEARAGGVDEPVVGAQAGGYNRVSTGIAVLGEFMSSAISAPAASALERLLAWKLSLHGLPLQGRVTVRVDPAGAIYSRFPANARVSLPRVAGHRDGDATDCPGDVLYGQLPAVRTRARALAGRAARATIAIAAAPSLSPGATAPTYALSGSLAFLDGTPLAGAPIAIQARSVSRWGEVVLERTLAQTVTAADGTWSLAATLAPSRSGSWLRAVSLGTGGAPAAVSDPLLAPGVVSVTPAPGPAPTTEAVPPASP